MTVSRNSIEGSAFLDCLIEDVQILEHKDGITVVLIRLHVSQEHAQSLLLRNLRIFSLERTDQY
jgi:hypothetical protein